MALTKWNDSVQQFTADRADEALGVRVEVRTPIRQSQRLHATVGEHLAYVGGEHGVTVHEQVLPGQEKAIDGVEELTEHELDPRGGRVVRNPGDAGPACPNVGDEEHAIPNEATQRQYFDVNKIRGEHVAEVRAQEVGPLRRPLRRGVDPVVSEDSSDGRAADRGTPSPSTTVECAGEVQHHQNDQDEERRGHAPSTELAVGNAAPEKRNDHQDEQYGQKWREHVDAFVGIVRRLKQRSGHDLECAPRGRIIRDSRVAELRHGRVPVKSI